MDARQDLEHLVRSLKVLRTLIDEGRLDPEGSLTGLEIELSLIDEQGRPAMRNGPVLEQVGDTLFQPELGAYNIEFNVPPFEISGSGLSRLEGYLRDQLNAAHEHAKRHQAHIVMVGTLPTVTAQDLAAPEWMSAALRYQQLNTSILAERGDELQIDLDGPEPVHLSLNSIAGETLCTSVQIHAQSSPQGFAALWNAAQLIAAPQIAVAANSPYVVGRRVWDESRLEVFAQCTDTRDQAARVNGVPRRVLFGTDWITSPLELYQENLDQFSVLIPAERSEDPQAVLAAGGLPTLRELSLQNGTVWRWNRPVFASDGTRAHIRLENRVLPAGPSVIDTVANVAFFHGLVRAYAAQPSPPWERMSFQRAQANFEACAKHGLDARVEWAGGPAVDVAELIVRELVPMARLGLLGLGAGEAETDRYLEVIRQRALTRQNGAAWQSTATARFEATGLNRQQALAAMLREYETGMHANLPVHEWPLP